ncbi:MAG TPA: hypothetical protein PLZ92_10760 [Phycicoccus sp.]|nr:hypothetical protein [Phycicoccus sp.]HQK32147.1 hypothetical protein [Phycicoccus sp.]
MTTDPLTGEALQADVQTYHDFGIHRYGSPGEQAALTWIASELERAGLTVEVQPLSLARQLVVDEARISIDGVTHEAFPHWWPPMQSGPVTLRAPLRSDEDSAGAIAWLSLPYERGAYLNAEHRRKIMDVAAHNPAAIVLTIDNPAGAIFTYNVNQVDEPWPVPVIVVAARLAPELEAARSKGAEVTVDLSAHYLHDVASHNVIARIDNGAERTIVVSTPVSSWFTSSGERGPGIALFLAMARRLAQPSVGAGRRGTNVVFVATVGHEIGQGGMEVFLHTHAPRPEHTRAWLHFGASLACYGWEVDADGTQWIKTAEPDPTMRVLVASSALQEQVAAAFAHIPALPFFGEKSGVGELRDVRAAGYEHYFGMTGVHRFFHTAEDRASLTGPELLAPLAQAFATMLDQLSSG